MLGYDLEEKKRTFFNFRHTGAPHIAQRGKTPAHLLAVVQVMAMRELVLSWKRPDFDPTRSCPRRRRNRTRVIGARSRERACGVESFVREDKRNGPGTILFVPRTHENARATRIASNGRQHRLRERRTFLAFAGYAIPNANASRSTRCGSSALPS